MASRADPQFFNIYGLEPNASPPPSTLHGAAVTVVSEDHRGSGATYLARGNFGWRREEHDVERTLEMFILAGSLNYDRETLRPGDYLCIPGGSTAPRLATTNGVTLLAFVSGASRPLRAFSSDAEEWKPASPGLHGSFYKSLRLPDVTGSFDGCDQGFLRLLVLMPGLCDVRQHAHHECWEEVIQLTGDVLMFDRGLKSAGTYIGNPAGFWHAPFASKHGAILLVQTDAPMAVPYDYRASREGEHLVSDYMRSTGYVPQEAAGWIANTGFN